MLKRPLLCLLVLLGVVSMPAFAQVNFQFGVEIGPPPVRVEVVPAPRAGFIWAPGYWGWNGAQHVWIEGRWIEARPGQYWVPEHWEHHAEARGEHWHFAPGRWEREHGRWERDEGRHFRERGRRERD
jgi:hypothetical protein